MATWISAAGQIRSLAKAVSTAFAASALTEEEKNPPRIEITDLAWQAPPLIVPQMLGGAPVHAYLDVPVPLNEARIMEFWRDTLDQMWNTPSRLLRRGTLATLGTHMPKLKVGQRALRFAVPAGYPQLLEESAGAMFSLELAHACATSLPIQELVEDEDNYYVKVFGNIVGIKDGRIATDSPWDYDVTGQVTDLMLMPRGASDYTPRYDQITALRSVLYVHRRRFPKNFEALDAALQGLRLLTLGAGHCPPLVQEMYRAPLDIGQVRIHERYLRDAVETTLDESISDRAKLVVLHNALVPDIITNAAFKHNIFSGAQYPFTLAAGKLEQIESWLRQQYQERIPAEMQQLKGPK